MLSDKTLVKRLRQGDATAFDELYRKYIQRLHAFILKMAKSPELAEDVVHDVFVKIWEKRMMLDPERSFQSYLFTIGRNRLLNLIKRSAHEASIVEEMLKYSKQGIRNTEEQLNYRESDRLIHEAIEQLPNRRRAIFKLCRFKGLTYQQAANHLDISDSTVNSQMVKALKSIREYLIQKNRIFSSTGLLIILRWFKDLF